MSSSMAAVTISVRPDLMTHKDTTIVRQDQLLIPPEMVSRFSRRMTRLTKRVQLPLGAIALRFEQAVYNGGTTEDLQYLLRELSCHLSDLESGPAACSRDIKKVGESLEEMIGHLSF